MLESVIKTGKKQYPQTFLEECKYEIKKKTMENFINDDFDPSSSDKSDNEEYNDKMVNLMINLIINLLMINLMMNLKVKIVF